MLLFACVSCNMAEITGSDQSKLGQISFNCTKTKAEVTAASQITEFGVFAEQNLGKDGTAEATQWYSLLANEKIYRNTAGKFIYDNPRYWVDNRTFRFFAYYPYIAEAVVPITGLTRIAPVENATAFPEFNMDYVTPQSADADMLVATYLTTIDNDPDTAYPVVDIDFYHTLSRVSIQVAKHDKNKENKIEITNIEFGGVAKSATYNTLSGTWSGHSDYLEAFTTTQTLNEGDISFHEVFKGIYLPQSVNKGNKNLYIKVTYEFYTYSEEEGWKADDESYSATAYLPVGEWEPSKSYVYKMTLSAVDNTISFKSPTVDTWGTPNPAGGIIIQ